MDVATRLISLEDDPTLPVFTFRMWFLGLGLSCFGAVLGQIFVRTDIVLFAVLVFSRTNYAFPISTSGRKPSSSASSSFRLLPTFSALFWRRSFQGLAISALNSRPRTPLSGDSAILVLSVRPKSCFASGRSESLPYCRHQGARCHYHFCFHRSGFCPRY